MIPKAGCICTATKVTQEARKSFYRRVCSPSKHKNFLCIVTNKGFFLWWWDDCTWSSLSSTVKAVTLEKIKHKKGLVYWPCLPLQKKYCNLCVLSQTMKVSVFGMRFISKLAYLRRRSLSSRHWFDCGLVFEMWGGLYVVGKESRSVETHILVSRRNYHWFTLFDAVNRIWWENSYIVYIALLLYVNFIWRRAGKVFALTTYVYQFLGTLRLRRMT